MTTVLKLLEHWRHRLAHVMGLADVVQKHGIVSGVDDAGVAYTWEECRDCGALLNGLAWDREKDQWYIPGPRELRHNAALIASLDDSSGWHRSSPAEDP